MSIQTNKHYALIKLVENCAKVQREATKILRFGEYFANPITNESNIHQLTDELQDLYFMLYKVSKEFNIKVEPDKQDTEQLESRYEYYKMLAANITNQDQQH